MGKFENMEVLRMALFRIASALRLAVLGKGYAAEKRGFQCENVVCGLFPTRPARPT